jgi:glycosyltransferase involved in cell wall biosynthesis
MAVNNKPESGIEKMRVLRIAHASLTPALRERERAFARRYPEVELQLITTKRWREAEVEVEATPDDLFPVIAARTYLSKHIQLFAYDPRPIIRALRKFRPHLIDLNHEPYSVACSEVLTLCRWFAPDVPVVMHTNQNILHQYPLPFRWMERRALKRLSAAYACSETVLEVLRAKGFTRTAPVITYGVNTKAFSPPATLRREPGQPLTIGFVGRMLPGKGLNVLADALAKLKTEEWQLLLVGDGPECEAFKQSLAAHGLLERAQFAGAISYDQIPGYFHQMDVMVMPTQTTKRIREQFGRVLVEAMASGVPVIGSTCGAIPEVIGHAGLVVEEGDDDALADALRRMLSDEGLRQRLARAGRTRVEQQYSWESIADKMYELFHQVMKPTRTSVVHTPLELRKKSLAKTLGYGVSALLETVVYCL